MVSNPFMLSARRPEEAVSRGVAFAAMAGETVAAVRGAVGGVG